MARLSKYKTYTVLTAVIVCAVGIGFLLNTLSQRPKEIRVAKGAGPVRKELPANSVIEVSDGYEEMRLILRKSHSTALATTYYLYTADASGNEKLIYEEVMPEGTSIEAPLNTWSPDRSYIFVVKHEKTDSVLVFNASGEEFAENQKFLNVSARLSQEIDAHRIKEATGWAAENLLIVKTETNTGSKGQTYWFEVPSNSFLAVID